MSTHNSLPSNAGPLAPVAQWGDHNHSGHVVQFYGEDGFLLDELSRFIGTALGAGEAAVVIATKEHRDGLARRLQAWGLDTVRAAAQGRYVALDAALTLSKISTRGCPDAIRFAEVIGGVMAQVGATSDGEPRRIAAFGEMVALLWADGKTDAAIDLERLWNELARTFSFSLRCAYPMSSFHRQEHGDLLLKVCAEHSAVIPGESYTALASQDERLRSIAHLQQKAQALETEVAERRRAEEKLRRNQAELESLVEQRTAALRQLSSRLLSLQDSERRRIARELHDSLGQYLVALKLNVDILQRFPARTELWSQSEELMERCIAEVRTLSYLLHPPTMDAVGIASAARWYVEGFGLRSGLKLNLDTPNDPVRLPDATELVLFRVLQEALTNVHRHSGASAADILIRRASGQVTLEVRDNGRGIDEGVLKRFRETGAGTGVGLMSMHERARELGGKFELESSGTGTSVRITIPVPVDCAPECRESS
ncbi:MAG TPA: ATP-binding protein [Terriglobales bacterium]|jgi:signal transduction histidine kinase|nr:ATP-binding protein [Terriglobales bacterium]